MKTGDARRPGTVAARAACLPLLLLPLLAGCARGAFIEAPPNLPAGYYNCIEVKPAEITWEYYGSYANRWQAEKDYNDKYYVFKDITVTKEMLANKDEGFIWVEQVKCWALQPEAIGKLKVGQDIDIVGLNKGVPPDEYWYLLFKDCVFIPAGSLALPVGGGEVFTPAY